MATTRTQIKNHILEAVTGVSKVVARNDDTFSVQRTYFYRHGNTAEGWGERVMSQLGASFELVRTQDHWNAWPKDSFFEAVVRKVN